MNSIRYVSDIHLEMVLQDTEYLEDFKDYLNCVLPPLDTDSSSILVLAGDIFVLQGTSYINQAKNFLSIVCPRFAGIVYVPGNHEFYGGTIQGSMDTLKMLSKDYAFHNLSDHETYPSGITLQGTQFVGDTLWSDTLADGEVIASTIYRSLSDYVCIHNFTISSGCALHDKAKRYFSKFKAKDRCYQDPLVVVTHHLPSKKSIPTKYAKSAVNAAFATDLDSLVLDLAPKLWIHGHTHQSSSYFIGDTPVLANPYGYNATENPKFSKEAVVII